MKELQMQDYDAEFFWNKDKSQNLVKKYQN